MRHGFRITVERLSTRLRQVARHDMVILSLLAFVVGGIAGGAVIVFREAIDLFQVLFYDTETQHLSEHAQTLPWWRMLLAPLLGGLAVGLLIYRFMPQRRPQGVADVIEASTLKNGRMEPKAGFWAAVTSALSIGAGASVGREGPAVHLGATLGSWISDRLHFRRNSRQTLLGCGVASAVAASFNAPIAGALFANEVVLGHYALSSLAPVVIASVAGTVVSRAYFGDFPAFVVSEHELISFWEIPAFLGLGITAGIAASLLVQGVKWAHAGAMRLPAPPWLRPAVGGALVGVMALFVPQVLGIGYGETEAALTGRLDLLMLTVICAAKLVATAISLGFGFGGGIFSPSLVIGATLGGAFGTVASGFFPDLSAGASAYTIIGMGAVAAAVLGAPISTTLIVFEMTRNDALTMAVMLAVVVSTVIYRAIHGRSFFQWQLEHRGLDLHGGFQKALLERIRVGVVMSDTCDRVRPDLPLDDIRHHLQRSTAGQLYVVDDDGILIGTLTLADLSHAAYDHAYDDLIKAADVVQRSPPMVCVGDDLGKALKLLRTTDDRALAVVDDLDHRRFVGCLGEREAVDAYNQALIAIRREERQ